MALSPCLSPSLSPTVCYFSCRYNENLPNLHTSGAAIYLVTTKERGRDTCGT